MSAHTTHTLLTVAVQHLWHAALLLALVLLVVQRARLSAEARSWLLCGAFVLAAVSPLLVLLPREAVIATEAAVALPTAAQSTPLPISSVPAAPASPTASLSAFVPTALQALAMIWLLGTLWGLLRLAQGIWQARRLHSAARPSPALDALLGPALPRGSCVALSDAVAGPMVVGLFAPRILVPPHLASTLSPPALRDLLLHEAAHVQRRDLWVTALQRTLLAVYWWSPCLRMLGNRLELAREMACDARAAHRSSSGRDYADSLLRGVAGMVQHRPQRAALAVGMSGSRSGLTQRVDGLLQLQRGQVSWRTRVRWSALCLAALATHVGVTVAATPRLGAPTVVAPNSDTATRTASAQAERLLDAAADGDLAQVRQLVQAGVAVDTQLPGDGTALIAAARHGHLATVDALLTLGATPDLASRGDGNPLIAAARRGHLPVVERLVGAGADVNRIVAYDETPLINAARSGDVDTVAYLVNHGADVNLGVVADAGQWRSPLNQARNSRVHDYLIQRGAVTGRR